MESQDWIIWIVIVPAAVGALFVAYALLHHYGRRVWLWLRWRRLAGLSLFAAGAVLLAPLVYPYMHLALGPVPKVLSSSWGNARATSASDLEGGRLIISRLKLQAPIIESIEEEKLEEAVGHVPGTALPWDDGNTVIIGENFMAQWNSKILFSLLHLTKTGDDVVVEQGDRRFRYQVREKKVVQAEDIYDYIGPTETSQLTLITCYPPGTQWKRLVVFADKIPASN